MNFRFQKQNMFSYIGRGSLDGRGYKGEEKLLSYLSKDPTFLRSSLTLELRVLDKHTNPSFVSISFTTYHGKTLI